MRKVNNFLITASVLLAFTACNKIENESPDSLNANASKKVIIEEPVYCNTGDFFSSYVNFANIPGGFVSNGWVLIRNNESSINFYLKPSNGFADLPNNIDIGFYTGSFPTTKPDPDGLNYHYTTGLIAPELGFNLDFPIGNIYIENLGTNASLKCGEPVYIVVHYDAIDSEGNPYDIWTGSMAVEGYTADNSFWWYKYIAYTPACCQTCSDETAWAYGLKYVSKGNWATYTPYTGTEKSVKLFAGQTMDAGTVYFTPVNEGVNLRIVLNDNWSLQEVAEAVKIQGYDVAPKVSPSPGLFTSYKGNSFDITLPKFNFYGIHLDLKNCK